VSATIVPALGCVYMVSSIVCFYFPVCGACNGFQVLPDTVVRHIVRTGFQVVLDTVVRYVVHTGCLVTRYILLVCRVFVVSVYA